MLTSSQCLTILMRPYKPGVLTALLLSQLNVFVSYHLILHFSKLTVSFSQFSHELIPKGIWSRPEEVGHCPRVCRVVRRRWIHSCSVRLYLGFQIRPLFRSDETTRLPGWGVDLRTIVYSSITVRLWYSAVSRVRGSCLLINNAT